MLNTLPRTNQTAQDSRATLARLFATENLTVEHSPAASTAAFDTQTRTLILPVWKDSVSNQTYTMFVAHEVGHALYTPADAAVVQRAVELIDPIRPRLVHQYLNVVEDARIERMMKSKYPGLRGTFLSAYRELYDKGFFGVAGMDLSKLPLIDRVNIHFKAGFITNVPFSQKELALVEMVEKARTFDDVCRAAKAILDYAKRIHEQDEEKSKNKQPKQPKQSPPKDDDIEDSKTGSSNQGGDQQDPTGADQGTESLDEPSDDDSDQSESGESESDQSDSGESESGESESGESESGESESGESESDQSDSDGGESGKGDAENESGSDLTGAESDSTEDQDSDEGDDGAGSPSDGASTSREGAAASQQPPQNPQAPQPAEKEPEESMTAQALDKGLKSNVDQNAQTIQYVELPSKLHMDKIVVDYKEAHTRFRAGLTDACTGATYQPDGTYKNEDRSAACIGHAAKKLREFENDSKKVVAMMAKEFELRRQADRHSRSQTAKTGRLDLGKLHKYKLTEDLFLRSTSVPDGQSHGLVMVIDWSGSMSGNMAGTIKQLLNLTMFARKVGIPFEVYAFTDNWCEYSDPERAVPTQDLKVGEAVMGHVRLVNLLSSRMRANEYKLAMVHMMYLAVSMGHGGYGGYDPQSARVRGGIPKGFSLGGTPLDETIMVLTQLVPDFKKRTGVQIVNTTILTDGEAGGNSMHHVHGRTAYPYPYNTRTVLRDPTTKLTYEIRNIYSSTVRGQTTTAALLSLLRDRTQSHVVGFYLISKSGGKSHIERLFPSVKRGTPEFNALVSQFKSEKYLVCTEAGFDEYYVVPGDDLNTEAPNAVTALTAAGETSARKIGAAFVAQHRGTKTNRVVLTRFVQTIAKKMRDSKPRK